jgi:hypothetical protein
MILSIKREFNLFPNIVGITTNNDLTNITTSGYFGANMTTVELLNNGVWQWEPEDIVLIYYATNQIGWFTYDPSLDTFVPVPANGGISNALPAGDIIVGNSSNIATAVTMSGDVHIDDTGATTIQPGAVTGSKIANNAVDFTQLAPDVSALATISLTAAQILGMYATPVLLVAAPGAGKIVIVDSIIWDVAFVSTQYAGGGPIIAQYTNTAHGAGGQATDEITAGTLNSIAASSFIANGSGEATLNVLASASKNTAVYLSNTTGPFTTGNSTATLYVQYRILSVA